MPKPKSLRRSTRFVLDAFAIVCHPDKVRFCLCSNPKCQRPCSGPITSSAVRDTLPAPSHCCQPPLSHATSRKQRASFTWFRLLVWSARSHLYFSLSSFQDPRPRKFFLLSPSSPDAIASIHQQPLLLPPLRVSFRRHSPLPAITSTPIDSSCQVSEAAVFTSSTTSYRSIVNCFTGFW